MKKKILLIATGGTIASLPPENGLAPALTSGELLAYAPDMRIPCEIDSIQICSIDSTDVTPEIWLLIARTVEQHYENYDGFVICHGTDTMAYSASALSYLIQDSAKPIVFTGAQKPISMEITDAKTNLRDSILYACQEDSHGVSLVFDGKVIAGTRAKKVNSKSYHAFASINYPELAVIRDERMIRYIPVPAPAKPVTFYHNMKESVFLLKLTPGMSADILSAIFEKYDCIILESFGVGGIPHSLLDEFYRILHSCPAGEKIVVMTTQVVGEGSDVGIYEVGQRVKQSIDCLEAYDMTLESVFAKMMWLLAIPGLTWEERKERFYQTINYDIAPPV